MMETVLKTNKRTSISFSLKRFLMLIVAVMTVMAFFACSGDDPAKEDDNGGNGGDNGGGNGGNGQGKVWVDKTGGKTETFADLDAALWYLMTSGLGDYTVRIGENQHITSDYNAFMLKGKNITLKAESGTVEITRKHELFQHFVVSVEATLTLEKGIILKGFGDIDEIDNGITVDNMGKLIMNEGVKLYNFGSTSETCAAVNVSMEGIFEMNGGTICDNISDGVLIGNNSLTGGIVIMNGGTISGNGTEEYNYRGVDIQSGTFTMNDGIITENEGGGVGVDNGTFTMKNGRIINNAIKHYGSGGGGVWVGEGTFILMEAR